MEQISNGIWGPALWAILHYSTERIGMYNGVSSRYDRLPSEEPRIWIGLLKSLQYSLPCPSCKKHYTDYYSSHPLVFFTKDSVRKWLFDLHSHINIRQDKLNVFELEYLSDIYSNPFQFTQYYAVFVKQLSISIKKNISIRDDVLRTIRFLEEMKRFYDF
jgi:hypothetical protein